MDRLLWDVKRSNAEPGPRFQGEPEEGTGYAGALRVGVVESSPPAVE